MYHSIVFLIPSPNEVSISQPNSFVEDRKGHDFRYSIDCEKVKKELGWEIDTSFGEGIRKTIEWYMKKLKQ